jgi:hypothetical protein
LQTGKTILADKISQPFRAQSEVLTVRNFQVWPKQRLFHVFQAEIVVFLRNSLTSKA